MIEQQQSSGPPASITSFDFCEPSKKHHDTSNQVAYLLHSAFPQDSNGYAVRSHGLLKGLRKVGWNVQGIVQPGSLVKPQGLEEIYHEVDDVPYLRLETSDSPPPRIPFDAYVRTYAKRVTQLFEHRPPAIVHAASNYLNGLAAVEAARMFGVPSVYEVRGLWEVSRRAREPEFFGTRAYMQNLHLETLACQAADHCITISEGLKQELVSRGVPAHKITIAPNAVDAQAHTPQPVDQELKAALGLQDSYVVGYLGSIVPYEGIETLFEALYILRESPSRFHALIVGDGTHLDWLKTVVENLGLGDRVTFTGRVAHGEVGKYTALTDAVALPRHPAAVCNMVPPLKPFEAMAQKRLVIASDVPAIKEFIQDGVNGRLFNRGDAHHLASTLQSVALAPTEHAEIVERAYSWIHDQRTWQDSANIISNVYSQVREAH